MNCSRSISVAIVVMGLLFASSSSAQDAATANAPTRATWNAIRMPDGAIKVDGLDNDWLRAGEALKRCELVPDVTKAWGIPDINRGAYEGKDDCSITLHFAHDSENLYILANVRDQFLVNTADADGPNNGDDMELFIDANPPAERFAEKYNQNVRQYIFVPANVNPKWNSALVWQSDKRPAQASSRLRPWGYTIEIAIPKASFPYWKEHPELDSIGLEGMIADADAPGVDIHHPSLKGVLHFGKYHWHFSSAQEFGLLKLEEEPVNLSEGAVSATDPSGPKAALLMLAHRPELEGPSIDTIIEWTKDLAAKKDMESLAKAKYGLIALARRHKMPVAEMKDVCLKNGEPSLVLTYAWCCGVNGDKAATPILAELLKSDNVRIRMMATLAMGELGDKAAIEPLKALLTGPRISHNDARLQAEDTLRKLGVQIEPLPPKTQPK